MIKVIFHLKTEIQRQNQATLKKGKFYPVLTWEKVRNATSYKVYVYVDDFCRETFDAESGVSLSFLQPGIYEIAVKAIGDLTLYSPSALSEKIPFVVEEEKWLGW